MNHRTPNATARVAAAASLLHRIPPVPWLLQVAPKLLRGRGGRGIWMLCDQAVASLGNFATGNILARYLRPESQFGAYGLILETLLFLNSLQAALVNYPLTIEVSSRGEAELKRSASAGLLLTLLLLPLLGGP